MAKIPLAVLSWFGMRAAEVAGNLGLLPTKPLVDYGTAFWNSLIKSSRLPVDVVIRLRLLGRIRGQKGSWRQLKTTSPQERL